jgi:uncharacterized OB-fold protein
MPKLSLLQEELYAAIDGVPRLMANTCDVCNRVFFPRRSYCGRCSSPALREHALSRTGVLHAFSLIDRKPKLAVIDPPYVQAEVAMPEGVHVFTVLGDCNYTQLHIGMAVEMYLDEFPAPGGEGEVEAYMFRPVSGEKA